jgi:hypothetical protein
MNVRLCARAAVVAAAAALSFVPAAVAVGQLSESATFYLTVGNDTLIVERMTRLPNRLQFQLFDTKRLGKVDLTAELLTSALVSNVDVSFFKSVQDTIPIQRAAVHFVGDSVGFLSGGARVCWHAGVRDSRHPAG